MSCAKFIVTGTVQGVFFRASTRAEAVRLELTGHARNLGDGSVEVLACGNEAAIDALERWLVDALGPAVSALTFESRYMFSLCAGKYRSVCAASARLDSIQWWLS